MVRDVVQFWKSLPQAAVDVKKLIRKAQTRSQNRNPLMIIK